MNDWIMAKKELSYRIKQETNYLVKKGYDKQVAKKEAKKIVEPEIKLRAFIHYCALKDDTDDNWLKAEYEFIETREYLKPELREYAYKVHNGKSLGMMPIEVAFKWAELEFIKCKAYFIWEKNHNMKAEWYYTEECLKNEINKRSEEILNIYPYLSPKEAFYCARDQFYGIIKSKIDKKQKWVSERAYYLSQQHPKNNKDENWYRAVQEFNAEDSMR